MCVIAIRIVSMVDSVVRAVVITTSLVIVSRVTRVLPAGIVIIVVSVVIVVVCILLLLMWLLLLLLMRSSLLLILPFMSWLSLLSLFR